MGEMIDVFERWQGPIDWHAVHAAGVDKAYIKITNGSLPAVPPGDDYVLGCNQAGITAGGYAYALGGSDPFLQASVFASELQRLRLARPGVGLAPMLDFEDASLPTDPGARRGWILAFCGFLVHLFPDANRQLLYSSGNELQQIQPAQIVIPGVQLLEWDAEWGPNDGTNHPITAYTGTVAVHQYTSRGRVPGIGGLVDRDQVSGDISLPSVPNPPVVPSPIPPGTYLRIGSTGPYVTKLQHTLNVQYPLYSHLTEDGIYGPITATTVREFQRRAHILVDGIAGPQTLNALGLQ